MSARCACAKASFGWSRAASASAYARCALAWSRRGCFFAASSARSNALRISGTGRRARAIAIARMSRDSARARLPAAAVATLASASRTASLNEPRSTASSARVPPTQARRDARPCAFAKPSARSSACSARLNCRLQALPRVEERRLEVALLLTREGEAAVQGRQGARVRDVLRDRRGTLGAQVGRRVVAETDLERGDQAHHPELQLPVDELARLQEALALQREVQRFTQLIEPRVRGREVVEDAREGVVLALRPVRPQGLIEQVDRRTGLVRREEGSRAKVLGPGAMRSLETALDRAEQRRRLARLAAREQLLGPQQLEVRFALAPRGRGAQQLRDVDPEPAGEDLGGAQRHPRPPGLDEAPPASWAWVSPRASRSARTRWPSAGSTGPFGRCRTMRLTMPVVVLAMARG